MALCVLATSFSCDRKYRQVAYYLFFSIIFVFTIIRYRTGTDWQGYEEYFYYNNFSWEPIWSLINHYIYSFGFPAHVLFIVVGCLSLFVKLLSLNRVLKREELIFGLFLLVPVLVMRDWGTIRQGLALSFCLLSLSCLKPFSKENRYGFFLLWVFISSQIHLSAIVFLIVPLLMRFELKPIGYIFLIFGSILLSKLNVVNFVLEILGSLLGDGKLFYKISKYSSYNSDYQESVSIVPVIKRFINLIAIFFFAGWSTKNLRDYRYRFFFNLTIFSYCIFVIFNVDGLQQFKRVVMYFSICEAFLFAFLINAQEKLMNRFVLVVYSFLYSFTGLFSYISSYGDYLYHYDSWVGLLY